MQECWNSGRGAVADFEDTKSDVGVTVVDVANYCNVQQVQDGVTDEKVSTTDNKDAVVDVELATAECCRWG